MAVTRKKVLWVDDEIEFLRSHIMFLETRGYSVIPVFSGDDAIELLNKNPREFDIVLLDEQMPGKDGLTTLEEIKTFIPDLPVVMVTKSEEEQVMEDALGKKIDGYLTKPVNPSQILSVCKSILHSHEIISNQITRKFVRHSSEHRAALARDLSADDWAALYENLVYWDFELEKCDDEGLRQNHSGQKSDCNEVFCRFMIENYGHWMRNEKRPPVLSNNVFGNYLKPVIETSERVVLMVLDCMRLDQFFAIESLLKSYYTVDHKYFYSILPCITNFSRRSMFSGKLPLELSEKYPEILDEKHESVHTILDIDKDLLKENIREMGISMHDDDFAFSSVMNSSDAQTLYKEMNSFKNARLHTIVVDFVDMLTQGRSTSSILQEIAPDESSFRALTKSWFQYSAILQILRELSNSNTTVVITTDHGSALCSRGTELYGAELVSNNIRCKFGNKITCDERHAMIISTPEHFHLPGKEEEFIYLLAKENFHFVTPHTFEKYKDNYKSSFYYGGLSMEEIIVPFAILRAR